MPLLLIRHPYPGVTFGLWKIAEDEDYFRSRLPLTAEESGEVDRLKGLRRLEWLASRWMLHLLTGASERIPLAKDAFSKPFFLSNPGWHCSLSHSHGVVGAVLSSGNCGCDLQLKVNKMAKLAHKFLHPEEAGFIAGFPADSQLDLQHLFWTAKESLYKAYGLKTLDFKLHLRLDPFEWPTTPAITKGYILKSPSVEVFKLHFEPFWVFTTSHHEVRPETPDALYWWAICIPV